MVTIRQANIGELSDVALFYCDFIASMRGSEFKPDWEMGVYPTEQLLENAIAEQTLFLAHADSRLAGAMIINHECEPDYANAKWQTDSAKDEVMIIHLLGVAPACQGKGVAKEMVASVIEMCAKNSIKAIRLDVLKKNIPAIKLYMSMGFQYIDTVNIFYEDTGFADFLLYELAL